MRATDSIFVNLAYCLGWIVCKCNAVIMITCGETKLSCSDVWGVSVNVFYLFKSMTISYCQVFLCVFVLKPFHDFPCCLCFWWLNPLLDRWEMHICHKNIFDVCLFSCSCWTVRFDCFLEDQICFIFIFELWIILCLNLLYVKRISIQIFWQCNEKGWLDLNVLGCHKQSCVFTYKTLWRSEIII